MRQLFTFKNWPSVNLHTKTFCLPLSPLSVVGIWFFLCDRYIKLLLHVTCSLACVLYIHAPQLFLKFHKMSNVLLRRLDIHNKCVYSVYMCYRAATSSVQTAQWKHCMLSTPQKFCHTVIRKKLNKFNFSSDIGRLRTH